MQRVFIDTNIYLEMYHLSGPDLKELNKLIHLLELEHLEIVLTKQVEDEYWRNREGTIADAMKEFKKTKAISSVPNIIRSYDKYNDLKSAIAQVNNLVKELDNEAFTEINSSSLLADKLISQIFSKATMVESSTSIISHANLRIDLGNPPGKKGSLGDAINWEVLLNLGKRSDTEFDLVILSNDGDFESELQRGFPKEFLKREWSKINGGGFELFKNLTDYLHKYFPNIDLSDESRKTHFIKCLTESTSFASTHKTIEELDQFNDYSSNEIIEIMKAYLQNDQVYKILQDADVERFAYKISNLAKSKESKRIGLELMQIYNPDFIFPEELPF